MLITVSVLGGGFEEGNQIRPNIQLSTHPASEQCRRLWLESPLQPCGLEVDLMSLDALDWSQFPHVAQ